MKFDLKGILKIKKIFFLLLLINCTNIYAEDVFDFYLHQIDMTQYPKVAIKGTIISEMGFFPDEFEQMIIIENNQEITNISFEYLYEKGEIKVFKINYQTNFSRDLDREITIKADDNGFHNSTEGNTYFFEKSQHLQLSASIECELPSGFINYSSRILKDDNSEYLESEKYILTKNGLNIREEPSINGKVLEKIPYGQKIKILNKRYGDEIEVKEAFQISFKGRWVKVQYNSSIGYVFERYLSFFPPYNREKDLEEFLEEQFSQYQSGCSDYNDCEYSIYDDQIIYNNDCPEYGIGYISFPYTDIQEVLLITLELFYDKDIHVIHFDRNNDEFIFKSKALGNEKITNYVVFRNTIMKNSISWNKN